MHIRIENVKLIVYVFCTDKVVPHLSGGGYFAVRK